MQRFQTLHASTAVNHSSHPPTCTPTTQAQLHELIAVLALKTAGAPGPSPLSIILVRPLTDNPPLRSEQPPGPEQCVWTVQQVRMHACMHAYVWGTACWTAEKSSMLLLLLCRPLHAPLPCCVVPPLLRLQTTLPTQTASSDHSAGAPPPCTPDVDRSALAADDAAA